MHKWFISCLQKCGRPIAWTSYSISFTERLARLAAKPKLDVQVCDYFYSDSLSDTPLALCSEHAHLVINRASEVVDWPELDDPTKKKVMKKIDTGWTIHLDE